MWLIKEKEEGRWRVVRLMIFWCFLNKQWLKIMDNKSKHVNHYINVAPLVTCTEFADYLLSGYVKINYSKKCFPMEIIKLIHTYIGGKDVREILQNGTCLVYINYININI